MSVNRNFLHLIFIVILIAGFVKELPAQENRKQELEKEKAETLQKIKQAEKILTETESKKKTSLGQLSALNQLISSRKNLIKSIKKELRILDAELNELQTIKAAMESDLTNLKNEYAAMLYKASKTSNSYNKLLFLFSAKTFNQLFMRLKYLEQYGETRINQVEQIEIVKNALSKQEGDIEGKRMQKNEILNQELKENQNLVTLKKKQTSLIQTLSTKEKDVKRELSERRKAARKLDKLIADIVKEEIAKSKNTSVVVGSSSFEGKKSKMVWPVPGFISNKFGRQSHQTLKGIIVDNYGVDIQTNKDEKVKAVYAGKVLRVALVPGSGTAVIVKHGEYFTVYSKMKSVVVNAGQVIKEGDIIGEVYTDGKGVTELEFQVWKNNQKLDPQAWLMPK